MKATNKAPEIADLINSLLPSLSREYSISEGLCVTCGTEDIEIQSFRDGLSVKEYMISGMCQECQDSVFGA